MDASKIVKKVMEIKILLKNTRKKLGLTLMEVSSKTGIPYTTVNSWERGAAAPRGKNRDIIAKFYNLPKESLDYMATKADGSREINPVQIAQEEAMKEYQTKPVMMHKSYWELAEKVMKDAGDVDFTELFTRLVKQAAQK